MMFCRHKYNCIMPARKKSKRGDNLQKLNKAHPKDLKEDEGAWPQILHSNRPQPPHLPVVAV